MARFDFEKGFCSLYEHANNLCNTIDGAALAAHRATGGCEHSLNVAIGELGEAFELISRARTLLSKAGKTLDSHERCVKELKSLAADSCTPCASE